MHLDQEQIERLLHGEMGPPAAASLERHLAVCADCSARLSAAKRDEEEVHRLLRSLDHPLPSAGALAVADRARIRPGGRLKWAAAIVAALGAAGAAYAAPGSPLPGWLASVLGGTGAAEPGRSATPPSVLSPPDSAGIALAPEGGVILVFAESQERGLATLRLTDEGEVVVRARGGAPGFTSELDRLRIDNRGSSASFDVRIPRDAARVEVWIGEQLVFLKEGARITTDAPSDAGGAYLLPLTSPGG